MEMIELQKMWQQYDARIAENTRINKEILKRMLRAKPERRINWVMLQTGAGLLLMPVITLILFTSPSARFSSGIKLYMGILLFGVGFIISFLWSMKRLHLLRKINFTNPITTTRKNINETERFQTTVIKMGYLILMPIILTGVFLLSDMHISTPTHPLTIYTITPVLLCIVVMFVSIYFKIRWKNWWFRKLNVELDELEALEKE